MSALAPSSVALRGPVAQSLARGVASVQVVRFASEALVAGNHTVLETNDPCRIDSLGFACNQNRQRLRIFIGDEEGQFGSTTELFLPRYTGQTAYNLEPVWLNLLGGETTLWKNGVYDTGNSQFAIWLKQPLLCPTGVKVQVAPMAEFDKGVSLQMVVSYFANPEA